MSSIMRWRSGWMGVVLVASAMGASRLGPDLADPGATRRQETAGLTQAQQD